MRVFGISVVCSRMFVWVRPRIRLTMCWIFLLTAACASTRVGVVDPPEVVTLHVPGPYGANLGFVPPDPPRSFSLSYHSKSIGVGAHGTVEGPTRALVPDTPVIMCLAIRGRLQILVSPGWVPAADPGPSHATCSDPDNPGWRRSFNLVYDEHPVAADPTWTVTYR